MSLQQGWKIKQADFSNAFVQATLDKDVYVQLPAMFNQGGKDSKEYCLKLKKSLYEQVNAPRYWYLHIKKGLEELGIKQSE